MEERMKLYDSGVYLVNGKEIMTDAAEVQQKTGKAVTKEQAAENTIAYGILKNIILQETWTSFRLDLTSLPHMILHS